MTETTAAPCRAKDPTLCPYHGAEIRANKALASGDWEAYETARTQMEEAAQNAHKGLRRIFPKENIVLPEKAQKPAPHNPKPTNPVRLTKEDPQGYKKRMEKLLRQHESHDRRFYDLPFETQQEVHEYESRKSMQERTDYLQASHAIPTPIEAKALFISLMEAQGAKIKTSEHNYLTLPTILNGSLPGKLTQTPGVVAHDKLGWSEWTPTQSGPMIPAGYGSLRLNLLILPDIVNQPLVPATTDHRKGWEWGHTTVNLIQHDPNSPYGFKATTNSELSLTVHKDVNEYRKGKTIPQLIEALARTNQNPALT